MNKILIIILSFVTHIAFSQDTFKFIGEVSICTLTKNNLKISKKLDDGTYKTVCDAIKKENGKISVNTLIANVRVNKGDSIYYDINTDAKGKFTIDKLPKDTFDITIEVQKYLEHEFKLTLESTDKIQRKRFCLSDSIFVAKTDSIIYSRIPYNSEKAFQDIKNGNVYFLSLTSGDSFLDSEDWEYLENKFGFKFLYDYPQFPSEYLVQAQNEYNEVVLDYLSKQCNCDFEQEYNHEVTRIFREKVKSCNSQIKELEENICKIIAAFNHKDTSTLNRMINSEVGLYILFRRGVMDEFLRTDHIDFANPVPEYLPYFDFKPNYKIQYESSPTYSCEEFTWSKVGLFCDTVKHDNLLSRIAFEQNEYNQAGIAIETIERIKKIEESSYRIILVDDNEGELIFYLSLINGKWYITILDRVSSDCSA